MAPPTGPRVARYRARPRRRAHTRPMRDEGEEAADFAVTVARTEAGRDPAAQLGAGPETRWRLTDQGRRVLALARRRASGALR